MRYVSSYCLALLRSGDYDRYISVLFAPQDKRDDLAALYAFNLEIARIRDMAKEPLAGEIRLRWWRDCVEKGYDRGQENPLMAALHTAIKRHDLPVSAFLQMCDARLFDLYNDAMPSRNDFEGYCGDTVALVMQLACRILDRDAAAQCADACGHGGVAQGASGVLRFLPVTTMRDQLYIPLDVLAAAGASRAALRSSSPDKAARERAAQSMLALASEHYHAFIRTVEGASGSVRAAFLPMAPVVAYLKQAEQSGACVFEQMVTLSRLRRQWLIMRTAVSGRFPLLS